MGLLQRQLEEDDDRGWRSGSDGRVCPVHVENDELHQLLIDNLEDERCSYCDSETSAPFDVLLERISEGIESEWGSADDEGTPQDEGEYAWPTSDTWDLLLDTEVGLLDPELFNHVHDSLPEHRWIERDFVRLRDDERMVYGWEEFSDVVKHKRRFFFGNYARPGDSEDPDFLSPSELLERIGRAVDETGMFRQLAAGTELWRIRAHAPKEQLVTVEEFGPPPLQLANTSGRMNPAGIPVLYVGCEKDTAVAEASHAYPSAEAATLARLSLVRPVWIVDLADPPAVPGLFAHEKARRRRSALKFLNHFARAIAEPFKPDQRVHIDYIPTQVVTEWFRTRFVTDTAQQVLGIAYRSARAEGGTNLALFVPDDENESGLAGLVRLVGAPTAVEHKEASDESED